MRLPIARWLFAVPVALIALVVASSVAFSQAPPVALTAKVGPYTAPHSGVIVNAGVTGHAAIVMLSDRTVVAITAAGLAPGAEYGVHVHSGRCLDFGPHFRFDVSGPGTRANEIWADLKSDRRGRAQDAVIVRPLPTGPAYSIVIHALSNPDRAPLGEPGHPGARIACGDMEAVQ